MEAALPPRRAPGRAEGRRGRGASGQPALLLTTPPLRRPVLRAPPRSQMRLPRRHTVTIFWHGLRARYEIRSAFFPIPRVPKPPPPHCRGRRPWNRYRRALELWTTVERTRAAVNLMWDDKWEAELGPPPLARIKDATCVTREPLMYGATCFRGTESTGSAPGRFD